MPVKASPVLYGWLAMLGSDVRIETPARLRDDYLAYLRNILGTYEG